MGGNVAFVQLLIIKGYWEGLNSHPSQETQNANLPIGDVMITRLIDFDIVGNVGHMDGNKLGVQRCHHHIKNHKKS